MINDVTRSVSVSTICLVSPGHLGSNPRLVKEAVALTEKGYRVHVIHGVTHRPDMAGDYAVLSMAKWNHTSVNCLPGTWNYRNARIRQLAARFLYTRVPGNVRFAVKAQHFLSSALATTAQRTPADLYIGHCLASLPAVVAAARKHRAKAGFDAEDFHSGEQVNSQRGRLDHSIARTIESCYLPQVHYLTTASPLIGESYRETYGVEPSTILNVFPLSEAVEKLPAPDRPSFYWFSQTIGAGRGLEEFIEILRRLRRPCHLDLRGRVTESFQNFLATLAGDAGIKLRFLPPDLPQAMVCLSAGYTAGLGLETGFSKNNEIALSNKIFTYLLAGIPVIMSRTRGQEGLARELGAASLLIDLNHVAESAAKVSAWLDNPGIQVAARCEAFRMGRERFNWDLEKEKFLHLVATVLNQVPVTADPLRGLTET